MISLNTNTTSLIAQHSLMDSTKLLNLAIERITTGFKINHASDNAANYSISSNMSTKISSYMVAEDNVGMGLDLISTAHENLDLISDKLSRLRALTEQAVNGTYGKQSLKAMNAEAASLINEIYRTKNNTEYNGNNVYGDNLINEDTIGAHGLEVTASGFMQEVQKRDVSAMTSLSSVDETKTLAKGTYSISSADELAKLARMQNSGKITADSEFVLGADIDLSAYSSGEGWVPIGGNLGYSNRFNSIFDGNGYIVSNLYINPPGNACSGLFGCVENAEIKNVGVKGGKVVGRENAGGLAGWFNKGSVTNCFSDIDMEGSQMGSLIGWCGTLTVDHCWASGNVKVTSGGSNGGGLIGVAVYGSVITNCFSTGNVDSSEGITVGGFIARLAGVVENSFSTGNVISGSGRINAGGFLGIADANSIVSNCHSTGNHTAGSAINVGGFIGYLGNNVNIADCYSAGDVYSSAQCTGGFLGSTHSGTVGGVNNISNCFATGNVHVDAGTVGGLIGRTAFYATITDCYATGNVDGVNRVGGLVGENWHYESPVAITNCYATGNVSGTNNVGGLCGYFISQAEMSNCYSAGKVSATGSNVSGINGFSESSTKVSNCKAILETGESAPFSFDKNYIGLQVGINASASDRITLESSFSLGELKQMMCFGINNSKNLDMLDNLIAKLSSKQTEYGAAENRLESALDEISTKYENLISSRSTLRDADIADVSSEYIRQQILQQASSTLLATANQSPALALQLL